MQVMLGRQQGLRYLSIVIALLLFLIPLLLLSSSFLGQSVVIYIELNFSDPDGQGKFQATVVCWILGFGSLVSWNSMLTIGDYYYNLFPVRKKNLSKILSKLLTFPLFIDRSNLL